MIVAFLFAIYPVISLYSRNQDMLISSMLWTPIALSIAGASLLMLLFSWAFRSRLKASVMTSGLFILSTFEGHLLELMEHSDVGRYLFDKLYFVLAAVTVSLIYFLFRSIQRTKITAQIHRALLGVGIALIAIPSSRMAWHSWRQSSLSQHPAKITIHPPSGDTTFPDIYYIILDGYGRQDALQAYYGHDNSSFVKFLEKKGFYVAPKSRCNYGVTSLSLASSLNMKYLDDINRIPDQESQSQGMILHNRVMQELKSRGYTIINFGSGWVVTNLDNPLADYNFNYRRLNEFTTTLMRTSLLRFFVQDKLYVAGQREVITYNLQKVKDVPHFPGPKFTFLHLVCPHPPFVFDRNGRLPNRTKTIRRLEADWLPRDHYIDQLVYLNGQIEKVVDAILKGSPRPPIIVIQGDHGPASDRMTANPDRETIHQRIAILNAYYFPGNAREGLYDTITPVNTFRLILDRYLGTHLGMLKDRNYYCGPIGASPYDFLDVTGILP